MIFKILFSSLLLCLVCQVHSQQCWEVFSPIDRINDIQFHEDYAYVAAEGAFIFINNLTGIEELITTVGTGLDGRGIKEMQVLSNGDAWLANYSDLFYYDGESYSRVSISQNDISLSKIAATDEKCCVIHSEYTSSWQTYLTIINNDSISYQGLFEYSNISSIIYDANNNLWVGKADQLIQYNPGSANQVTTLPTKNADQASVVYHHIDSNGLHWIYARYQGNDGDVIWSTDLDTWTEHVIPERMRKIFEPSPGNIHFTTWNLLGQILADGTVVTEPNTEVFGGVPSEDSSYIVHAIPNDSTYWVRGKETPGEKILYLVSPSDTVGFISTNFTSDEAKSMVSDCEANLITLNENYLQKYNGHAWVTIPFEYKNENCELTNLISNPYTCEVWGYGGGCRSLWKITDEEVIEIEILEDDYVSTIAFDQDGNVYVGGFLQILKIDSVGILHDISQNAIRPSNDLIFASDGSLWLVGSDSVHRFKDNEWERFFMPIDVAIFSWIYEDRFGDIWMYTGKNLHRYDGTDWELFAIDFLDDTIAEDMVQDSSGLYWISTRDGLISWNIDEYTIYDDHNSDMLTYYCRDLELVGDSVLWIQHFYNLSKLTLVKTEASSTHEQGLNINFPYSLYPNPSHGPITISNPQFNKRNIDIYTMSGALVSSHTSDDAEWSTNLEAGVYWVRIREGKSETVEKVVVLNN